MANILSTILGGGKLVDGVKEYFVKKMEIKAAKEIKKLELEDAIHKRKITLIEQGLTADMNWEMEFAKQANTSWKDEYTLIIVSIPAVLCFHPKGAQLVAAGFDALARAPLWYQTMLISIFLATYGIRWFRRTQSDT